MNQNEKAQRPMGPTQTAVNIALQILTARMGQVIMRKELLNEVWAKIEKLPPNRRLADKNTMDAVIDVHVLSAESCDKHGIERVGRGLYQMTAKKRAQGKKTKKIKAKAKRGLNVPQRVAKAVDEFLANKPDGERFGLIVQHVVDKKITTEGYAYVVVSALPNEHPNKYFRPARGYMCLQSALERPLSRKTPLKGLAMKTVKVPARKAVVEDEDKFYEPFAGFLQGEIEPNCVATKYGRGARGEGRGKWRTPDVVGLSENPRSVRPFFFTPEFISAEIKVASDAENVISGFGQACAYKVFSHKSYLVVPKGSDDIDRLIALCDIFGIGLVLFTVDVDKPDFDIRARAQSHSPHAFYVDKFLAGMPEDVRRALNIRHGTEFHPD